MNEYGGTGGIERNGYERLLDPILNKGTAFTEAERDRFGLHGLLPPHVASLDEQVRRRLEHLHVLSEPVERYSFLRELPDSNETLFYALLVGHMPEILPLVYTPTVGEGCRRFSHLFRRPRGLFLSPQHAHRLDEILRHPRFDDVGIIVMSDGERILGLGDQGAGGMGIPIGKLSLYTGCGGIHPLRTLPILLDTGTDNEELRADPLYVGWRHERVRGDAYNAFVDAVVQAIRRRWPHVLLQWEDFANANASPLLLRYQDQLCTFNDDIQGTAAVVLGTMLAAIAVSGEKLENQRVVVVGPGSAGLGIAELLVRALTEAGLDEREARRRLFLVGKDGLLTQGGELTVDQKPYARSDDEVSDWAEGGDTISLEVLVQHVRPTALIGVTGKAGTFTEEAVRAMAKGVDRPLVFPLSNPTANSEARPSDIMEWTDGRAIVGTGSPFDPVKLGDREVAIDQINNAYIFPGLGLGLLATKASRVPHSLFLAAARALAELSPAAGGNTDATLLPPIEQLRVVSRHIAIRVAEQVRDERLSTVASEDVEKAVDNEIWMPRYAEGGS